MEQWKVIPDFCDYEISSKGRLRSNKSKRKTILKERITHDGYVWYNLCKNGKQYTQRAHRLVAEAFIPNSENKPTVNHKDGNKLNNNVDNLEWATREEQMQHAYQKGLKRPVMGCLQGRHVLEPEEVRSIRSEYKAHDKTHGMVALARRYNVSQSTIDKCVRRKSYNDID